MGRDAHQSRPTPLSSWPPGAAEVMGPSDLGLKNAEASLKPMIVGTWFSSPRRLRIHCQQLEQGLLQNLAKLFAEASLLGGLT